MANQENENKEYTGGKFQRTVLQVAEAQALLKPYAKLLATEEVPLNASSGRILACAVQAPHPFPAFDRSAMDGYAVIAADLSEADDHSPVWLEVADVIPCGAVASRAVTSGTAARIMTGAQLPEGADTVVMLEATESRTREGIQYVGIRKPAAPGQHITPAG